MRGKVDRRKRYFNQKVTLQMVLPVDLVASPLVLSQI